MNISAIDLGTNRTAVSGMFAHPPSTNEARWLLTNKFYSLWGNDSYMCAAQ